MDHFVLQAIDPSFGCPTLEALVPSPDVEVLKKLLGPDCADAPDLIDSYTLDPDEARAVATQFGAAFDPIGPETVLYRLNLNPEIPYTIHTGFELFLMLRGTKPFALFTISYPLEESEDAIEVLFEPHVQTGLIVKRVVDEPFIPPIRGYRGRMYDRCRRLYYALPGEEWRIDANMLLWSQLKYVAWNETMERIWGTLLGHTDAQNDWWIGHLRHEGRANWSLITAYAVIDDPVLTRVRASGCRALPWDIPGSDIKIELRWPRPDPAALQCWMENTQSAAVIRLGFKRRLLKEREADLIDGVRTYQVRSNAIPELNGSLDRQIEIIAERAPRSDGQLVGRDCPDPARPLGEGISTCYAARNTQSDARPSQPKPCNTVNSPAAARFGAAVNSGAAPTSARASSSLSASIAWMWMVLNPRCGRRSAASRRKRKAGSTDRPMPSSRSCSMKISSGAVRSNPIRNDNK